MGAFNAPPPHSKSRLAKYPRNCRVNLRPAGGCLNTPLRFFTDSKKTAARSATGFSPTLSPIFLATFVKVSILGHARSGHQVRSSDHTLQALYNRASATVFEGKLWNFRNMIRSSIPTKCISRIFYIGDLRSGHFRDLPIISQWAKIKLPVYASCWAYMNGIASGKVFIDTPSEIFSRWPLLRSWRSLEVTNSFMPITWDPNEIEMWDWCHCVCLRQAHRMMYNLTYLGHRVTLLWLDLRSNLTLTFQC